MIVTFCGHRIIENKETLQKSLEEKLRLLLDQGANRFYLGGYGEFDRLAATSLYRLKTEYPDIDSVLVLPYLGRKDDSGIYSRTCYPPIECVPKRFAITYRNRWMVDMAEIVVAYVVHDWGGAYQTLSYAKHRGKTIILLNDFS